MSHIAHLGSSFKKQAYVINVLPLYRLLGLKKKISKVTTKISLSKYISLCLTIHLNKLYLRVLV